MKERPEEILSDAERERYEREMAEKKRQQEIKETTDGPDFESESQRLSADFNEKAKEYLKDGVESAANSLLLPVVETAVGAGCVQLATVCLESAKLNESEVPSAQTKAAREAAARQTINIESER
ncbi:MAG: hypothetical protein V1738_03030 [Patescibacteria group bacterium]